MLRGPTGPNGSILRPASDHVRSPGVSDSDQHDVREPRRVTITYDPHHPAYLDEADVRDELTRVFDVCHGCRLCIKLCTSFPTLFEMRRPPRRPGRRPAHARAAGPGRRRVLPVQALLRQLPVRPRSSTSGDRLPAADAAGRRDAPRRPGQVACATGDHAVMARTDLLGKVATRAAPLANRVVGAKPGSARCARSSRRRRGCRRAAAAAVRPARASRPGSSGARSCGSTSRQARVAVFPTCLVEYQEPEIGQDLVKVYERNGIECSLADGAGCCGRRGCTAATSSSSRRSPTKNVAELAATVRAGQRHRRAPADVRLHPEEGLRRLRAAGADAELVAAPHVRRRRVPDEGAQADGPRHHFPGEVPATVTYHTPCHLRAQDIGLKSRDLMKLTGARGEARPAVQRHRRHVGAAGRERRPVAADGGASSATRSSASAATSSPATAIWPTRRSPKRRAASRSIPSRSWPGHTASPRND